MSSKKRKPIFKSTNKIQSTIEHFVNKGKPTKKRKDKLARKEKEISEEKLPQNM